MKLAAGARVMDLNCYSFRIAFTVCTVSTVRTSLAVFSAGPAAAANFGNIEKFVDLPAKTLPHGGMVVATVVRKAVKLTSLRCCRIGGGGWGVVGATLQTVSPGVSFMI